MGNYSCLFSTKETSPSNFREVALKLLPSKVSLQIFITSYRSSSVSDPIRCSSAAQSTMDRALLLEFGPLRLLTRRFFRINSVHSLLFLLPRSSLLNLPQTPTGRKQCGRQCQTVREWDGEEGEEAVQQRGLFLEPQTTGGELEKDEDNGGGCSFLLNN